MATEIHTQQTFEHIKQEVEDNIKNTAAENDSTSESIKSNRILSLSGGGVKGIAELVVLAEIEERTGKSISELFPIITGTSVGGLIGALLTIPKEPGSNIPKYSAKEALDIFIDAAPKIFDHYWYDGIKQIFTHKHSQGPLKEILEQHLAGLRLDDTTSRLIIPVTDLASLDKGGKIFDSHDSYSPHIRVQDVLLATTAAPTYFKPVTNKEYIKGYENQEDALYAYADGGLGSNRPAYEALKILKSGHSREESAKILDDTMVLSLNFDKDTSGSSSIPKIGFDGVIGWLVKGKLVSRLMQSSEDSATAEVRGDLPGEDEFVEVKLPITKATSSLDNSSLKNIDALVAVGRKYIEDHTEQLQKLCDNLVKYVEVETKAMTHEKAAEDAMIAIEAGLDLDNSCNDSTIVNKEAITVTSDDIANSNEDANRHDSDDTVSNPIITNDNREQILDGIKQYLTSFANENPDLKENIEQYLIAMNDYSNQELEKLILDFAEWQKVVKEMELHEAESVLAPYMSYGIEASQESMEFEGIDDEVSNHEILA
ncbi:patatin (plasmid) [Rickettsia asiatica]|uniref:Patatin n=1 Tax=Rickettsia asiatica TaxID=238800 RepID=A0A510G938_9RICK|nr:patatin-like phospholipase family protein [Rickettsia asiatica]BBJ32432.1 patatin [Rickettsia asiatica]